MCAEVSENECGHAVTFKATNNESRGIYVEIAALLEIIKAVNQMGNKLNICALVILWLLSCFCGELGTSSTSGRYSSQQLGVDYTSSVCVIWIIWPPVHDSVQ